jgi:hypothetical protein
MANPVLLTPATRLIARLPVLPAAFLSLLMAGCVQPPPPVDPNVLLPPPVRKAPTAVTPAGASDGKTAAAAGANLAPLATPQQVVGAVDLGRLDPFGASISRLPTLIGPDGKPLPVNQAGVAPGGGAAQGAAAGGARPGGGPATAGGGKAARSMAPLQLPPGFSISGVIRSGGLSEAVVSYGALSGSLRPGDRGGRTTDLLPSGWSVAAIDVNRGLITLQKNGQRVSAEL